MLTYSFSKTGSDSLYEQLYKCIKNDILCGNLNAGEKLPAKRPFAENLGISVITVENAYSQLSVEGYIFSKPKKGYYVLDIKKTISQKSAGKIKSEIEKIPLSKIKEDFSSNQTETDNFPFSIWAKLMRECLTKNKQKLMTNSPSGGILDLRKAIAEYLKQFKNMKVLSEQIIIGAGTEYLYSLLVQLLGFNKKYGVEDPGYNKISQIYKSLSVSCNYISMDEQGVNIDKMEKQKIDVMHLSPSHHFPTGIVTPVGRRYELLGWASKKESRYIIEDEYDSEFRLTGKPVPTLQSIDVLGKVIYMNTFTKSLSSTIRISYMILPVELLNRFNKELHFYSCTVSNFEQYTLARFISEGHLEKHINRMRTFYHSKRDYILECIKKSPLAKHVKISEENSGLHFLLHVNTKLSDMQVIENAEKKGLKISSLSQYYQTVPENVSHVFIMNYSFIKKENVNMAINILYRSITQL